MTKMLNSGAVILWIIYIVPLKPLLFVGKFRNDINLQMHKTYFIG